MCDKEYQYFQSTIPWNKKNIVQWWAFCWCSSKFGLPDVLPCISNMLKTGRSNWLVGRDSSVKKHQQVETVHQWYSIPSKKQHTQITRSLTTGWEHPAKHIIECIGMSHLSMHLWCFYKLFGVVVWFTHLCFFHTLDPSNPGCQWQTVNICMEFAI